MSDYSLKQLRGAWGAGKASAEKEMQDRAALVGKYFHNFCGPGEVCKFDGSSIEGKINNQGFVLSEQSEGLFLIQLFSWLDGRPTDQKLVHISEMKEWTFYNSVEEMNHAYAKQEGLSPEDEKFLML